MMSRWAKISVVVGIISVVVGILGLIFTDRFVEFVDWLPAWILWLVSGTLFGALFGWYLRGNTEPTKVERVEKLVGCIEKNNLVWKGTANFSDGQVTDINISSTPFCPKCRTPLMEGDSVWSCLDPDCSHNVTKNDNAHRDAEKLFKSHISDIVGSEDEEYSLDSLIERIDDEVMSRMIWEEYAESVDDSEISTNCFN